MNKQLIVEISRHSTWRHLYSVCFIALIILIIGTAGISLLWILGLITGSLLVYFLALIQKSNQPVHITGCNRDRHDGYWQLLCPGRKHPILWEAQLVSGQSFYHCVQLVFDTQQPMQQRQTVLIWKDQVQAETWRELKVLTRWT